MHGYSHLLTGAALDLECAACLQVDDIGEKTLDLDKVMEHALAFFTNIGEPAKTASYELMSESHDRRAPIPAFCARMLAKGHTLGGTLRSLTLSAAGFEGNALSDTWSPRAVVSVAVHGRILEAFIQSPDPSDAEGGYLFEVACQMFGQSFAAAYIFQFPWAFSPLAYCSGISYSPNIKAVGSLAERDAERVTNWANHCYRGHRASEGYLRDVYGMNLLSEQHLQKRIGSERLEDWIRSDPTRGNLTSYNSKWLWTIDASYLSLVQRALDNERLLLAGFPPY